MKYISLTFDDGREDNYSVAYPIMKQFGLCGTIYCTTGYIDGTWTKPEDWYSSGNPISIEQLKDMQLNGWELGLHGDKHTTEVNDLKTSYLKMKSWGLVKDSVGFSMPNSSIEEEKMNEVLDQCFNREICYIRRGRKINTSSLSSKLLFGLYTYCSQKHAYNRFNNENLNKINSFRPEQIYSIVIRNSDDPKMIIKFVEQMPEESWAVFMLHSIWPQEHFLHGVDPWNWSAVKFRYFCSELNSLKTKGKVDIKTVMDVVEKKQIVHKVDNRILKNKVIVWSIDDFNTMGLMRELGQFDLDMEFLIKGKAGFASKSKYCKKYIETDSIEDGANYLIQSYSNEEYKPIVIISSDEIVTYVDIHRDDFKDRFILPITSVKGNIKKYIDKNIMTELAEAIGILCPQSRFVKWDSSVEGIEYPCLIKPSHQTPGHFNEFKFKICKNQKELRNTLKLVRHDSEFILQQYIPKELDLLVYGARMRDGNTLIAGSMIRDRWADSGSSSHGWLINEVPTSVDVSKIKEFVERIDYFGPFSCEYGLVGDKAYFFEINLRNDGTSHYFYQAGANIPLAYVYSCAGLDYSQVPTIVKGKNFFIDEVFDVENVLKCKISKKQWKQDMKKATIYKYYDKEDKEPWEIVKKTKFKQIAQDFLLSRYRIYIVSVMDKMGIGK